MIAGSVHPGGDAVVPLRVRGPSGTIAEFQTIVDTGFNDWLALPNASINSLGLTFREEGRYTLADGSEAVTRLFVGEVHWFDRWRRVLVAA